MFLMHLSVALWKPNRVFVTAREKAERTSFQKQDQNINRYEIEFNIERTRSRLSSHSHPVFPDISLGSFKIQIPVNGRSC